MPRSEDAEAMALKHVHTIAGAFGFPILADAFPFQFRMVVVRKQRVTFNCLDRFDHVVSYEPDVHGNTAAIVPIPDLVDCIVWIV